MTIMLSLFVGFYIAVFVWAILYTYSWPCKICGLKNYPHGCMGHTEPPADVELIHAIIWPHLPKGTTKIDRWAPTSAFFDGTKDDWPRIEVHNKHRGIDETIGYIWLRNNVLTLSWWEGLDPRFYDTKGTYPTMQKCVKTWNIADPNSTIQIVEKIKELRRYA